MEAYASFYYLAAASWCDKQGLFGCSKFMYSHAEEERDHMMRLFNYIIDAGGNAIAPAVKQPPKEFGTLKKMFKNVLEHEVEVTGSINNLVDLCIKEKDHSTNNFLQWFVAEQHEEEKVFSTIIDRMNIIGAEEKNLYWIDQEVEKLSAEKDSGGSEA